MFYSAVYGIARLVIDKLLGVLSLAVLFFLQILLCMWGGSDSFAFLPGFRLMAVISRENQSFHDQSIPDGQFRGTIAMAIICFTTFFIRNLHFYMNILSIIILQGHQKNRASFKKTLQKIQDDIVETVTQRNKLKIVHITFSLGVQWNC